MNMTRVAPYRPSRRAGYKRRDIGQSLSSLFISLAELGDLFVAPLDRVTLFANACFEADQLFVCADAWLALTSIFDFGWLSVMT